ncbi:MAG: hypothetical protein HYR66_00700 [Sphingobacteriales bacterium]|nr:hypothetical protein [Sphingobacteriales bacterium]MBI3720498.1 hypothetical protein [Sphingobacteriales bacterium]
MKQTLSTFLGLLITGICFAQTVTKITGLKDAWGIDITYIGEVKNKVPNGLGVAIYSSSQDVLRYAGYFENGAYSGKGVMIFKTGYFLSGNWKNGKLNGKGTNLNSTGDLYIGDFVNGKKEGKGTLIYKNNNFLTGGFKNDLIDGRNIYLSNEGKIISDNLYKEDKKNGGGFQYEVSSKKLYEGTWSNDQWVSGGSTGLNSFLKSPQLFGEVTEKQILIGTLDPATKYLKDSGFYYDLKNGKRYFGIFNNGYLDKGLIVRDDSSRMIGNYNDIGAYGYGYYYKTGQYYDEGIYDKDLLSGNNNLSIDVNKKTIYYGQTSGGSFTGDAWFANNSNDLYKGHYVKGQLNGDGWKADSYGNFVKGTFDNGYVTKITQLTTADGVTINPVPKTFAEAITNATILYPGYYLPLTGKASTDNRDNDDFYFSYTDNSLMKFPGTVSGDLVNWDDAEYPLYVAHYGEDMDSVKAIAKYKDLAKQVATASIVLKKGQKPVKLVGSISMPSTGYVAAASYYNYPQEVKDYSNVSVALVFIKRSEGKFRVLLICGEKERIEKWVDNINYGDDLY